MAAKRPIFQEVGQTGPASPAPTGQLAEGRQGARRAIRVWLMVLFALVVALIGVGGATRMTESGEWAAQWHPATGVLPPLSATDWQQAFDGFRAISDDQMQRPDMTLAGFQMIYWWEWGHQQLARLIGLVWALGFLGFLAFRKIPPGWTGRLVLLGVLGGVRGAVDWGMATWGQALAGINTVPYLLAVRLGLSFLILGLIAWYVLRLSRPARDLLQARRMALSGAARWGGVLIVIALLQIMLGGMVAGLDAGGNFVDWPMMNGFWLPPGMWEMEPAWRNLFENPGTVQFEHRVTGYVLFLAAILAWAFTRRTPSPAVRHAFAWMALVVVGQAALGIYTVTEGAPHWLALGHQFGAVLVVVMILRARFRALYPPAQTIRGN